MSDFEVTFLDFPFLQELCFKVIVNDFYRFTNAFEVTKDDCLKRNLNFLQRKYSQRILEELSYEGKLKEYHLNFLLNQHVEHLQIFELLQLTSKKYLLDKLIPIGQNLRELSCENGNFFKFFYEEDEVENTRRNKMQEDCRFLFNKLIPHAVRISELKIPFICNDNLLHLIANSCPQLTFLDVSDSRICGDGLKALYTAFNGSNQTKCPLKYINLINVLNINHKDIAALLENVPTLEEVKYKRFSHVLLNILKGVSNKTNYELEQKKYNLTKLEFDFNSRDQNYLLEEHLKSCSEACVNIKVIRATIFLPKHLVLCCSFPNLESVDLSISIQYSISLNSFLKIKGFNLKHLKVTGFDLSIIILIENCPKLETLHLCINELDKLGAMQTKFVKKILSLNSLHLEMLYEDDCWESVLLLLNSCPNLENLHFSKSYFPESNIVENFIKYSLNCNLKQLKLTFTEISFKTVKQLILQCNSLISFKLEYSPNLISKDILELKKTVLSLNRSVSINYYL